MSSRFQPWNYSASYLLPPTLDEFVPEDHLAHFVRDLVAESLDLSKIYSSYHPTMGKPAHNPGMMLALTLYSYCRGVFSSRKIAVACIERLDYKVIVGCASPDFRRIGEFRKRHIHAMNGLFSQVLELCRQAGMVKLGHVSIDGTKLRANASKHKAMSYGRMNATTKRLREEVNTWFERAAQADDAEDLEFGFSNSGQEMPDWCKNKQQRIKKIKEAKKALEERTKSEQKSRDDDEPPTGPNSKDQINFTDPESRIMPTADGFQQSYNAQAAVDAASQVIVATAVTQDTNDKKQLLPMVEKIKENCGKNAEEISADSGYCSEQNLASMKKRKIQTYIATGRQKHGEKAVTSKSKLKNTAAMTMKLKLAGYRSRYRLRKQTVEPVFGQIKFGRGFRQFLTRGLSNVTAEWELMCITHNILKLRFAKA